MDSDSGLVISPRSNPQEVVENRPTPRTDAVRLETQGVEWAVGIYAPMCDLAKELERDLAVLARALVDADSWCEAYEGVPISYWAYVCGQPEIEKRIKEAVAKAQAILAEAP